MLTLPAEVIRSLSLPAVSTVNVSTAGNLIAVLVSPVWTILSAISTSPVNDPVDPATVPPLMLPVTLPAKAPANDAAVNAPVSELKVRLVPLLGARSPVAAVTNSGKQVVSLDSSATVICDAAPSILPAKEPTNDVAVNIPETVTLPLAKIVAPTPDVPKFT